MQLSIRSPIEAIHSFAMHFFGSLKFSFSFMLNNPDRRILKYPNICFWITHTKKCKSIWVYHFVSCAFGRYLDARKEPQKEGWEEFVLYCPTFFLALVLDALKPDCPINVLWLFHGLRKQKHGSSNSGRMLFLTVYFTFSDPACFTVARDRWHLAIC